MNHKGFAISGILYTLLILFLVFITIILFNLQNRKMILDTLKADTIEAVERDNDYEYLWNEINSINASLPKLLWENPNPDAAFEPQTIILSSSDYDILKIYYKQFHTQQYIRYEEVLKGFHGVLTYVIPSGIETFGTVSAFRDFTYIDDITLSFANCKSGHTKQIAVQNNNYIIPLKIYGIKTR